MAVGACAPGKTADRLAQDEKQEQRADQWDELRAVPAHDLADLGRESLEQNLERGLQWAGVGGYLAQSHPRHPNEQGHDHPRGGDGLAYGNGPQVKQDLGLQRVGVHAQFGPVVKRTRRCASVKPSNPAIAAAALHCASNQKTTAAAPSRKAVRNNGPRTGAALT